MRIETKKKLRKDLRTTARATKMLYDCLYRLADNLPESKKDTKAYIMGMLTQFPDDLWLVVEE